MCCSPLIYICTLTVTLIGGGSEIGVPSSNFSRDGYVLLNADTLGMVGNHFSRGRACHYSRLNSLNLVSRRTILNSKLVGCETSNKTKTKNKKNTALTSSVLRLWPYIAERRIQDMHRCLFHELLYNLKWYLVFHSWPYLWRHYISLHMCLQANTPKLHIFCIFFFSSGERFPRSNIWSNTYGLYWLSLFFPIREILPTTCQWRKGWSDWVHFSVLTFCRLCVLYQTENYHQSLLKEETPSYQKTSPSR